MKRYVVFLAAILGTVAWCNGLPLLLQGHGLLHAAKETLESRMVVQICIIAGTLLPILLFAMKSRIVFPVTLCALAALLVALTLLGQGIILSSVIMLIAVLVFTFVASIAVNDRRLGALPVLAFPFQLTGIVFPYLGSPWPLLTLLVAVAVFIVVHRAKMAADAPGS